MPKNKQKAAIYCRVSTIHQVDKDSLPMQRNDLINYAQYALGISEYEIFEDAGYSGKNTDRPAYQSMLKRVRNGEFSHILVWKIDRISRNLLDFATMYAEFKNLGIIFVSKNEQFDTSTAMGEAMLKIVLVFAELERNMTSERVTATMLSRANEGHWNGGRVPYGYDFIKEKKQFIINEEMAKGVHLIFDEYENLKSVVRVTQLLNERNILTRNNQFWSPTTITLILRNPFYIGLMRYNYHKDSSGSGAELKSKAEWISIPNHHNPIISEEQFTSCNELLKQNQRSSRIPRQRRFTHIFAGIIHCWYCNRGMNATIDRKRANGYRPSLYICGEKRRHRNCPNIYINDITVGSFVFNYIANMIKLQMAFNQTMQTTDIQNILLDGNAFSEVNSITSETLCDLRYTLMSSIVGTVEYDAAQSNQRTSENDTARRIDIVIREITKKERALDRLKNLYLYSDDALSEKEYLLSKKELAESLAELNIELSRLQKQSIFSYSISDEELLKKSALFLMSQKISDTSIDFTNFALDSDSKFLKEFINSIISKMTAKDGRIMSIQFKNNSIHNFIYIYVELKIFDN